ncbi:alpha/beta fold hydrolase [Pararhodonellum marinum]|uniref:alpha/beta fold hydrolase n=1 Tax=Pararhodonellum marinum TaxID=2755358 RepID=UPI00188F4761|nr:alpha/beta fold hydrolase [Pararhodonellum marinum]
MKTYVLVHGAWAGKFAWDQVKTALESKEAKVITFDLPAHGDDNTPVAGITLETYVDVVTDIINQQEGKVILVGHSMGGMVISQVAENIPAKIEKLVYVSAYLPANGQDIETLSATDAGSLIGPNLVFLPDYSASTIKPDIAVKVFADDCTDDVKQLVLEKHKAEPLAPFQGKVTLTESNFGAIPKYYVKTAKDVGVSTANQERMIQANGTLKQVYTIDSGHSPYFAKPTELVKILKEV